MLETLHQIDTEIFLWLNNHTGWWLDNFMWMFSGKLTWAFFYLAILLGMWYRYGWKRALGLLLLVALIIAVCDQTCGHYVRKSLQRLRPSNLENPISHMVHIVNNYRGGPYGFPSCHAANSFALATFVSLLFRRWFLTLGMFLWALITAYSRVILGVHYTGDLMIGAIAGVLIATAAYFSARAIYRRRQHEPVEDGDQPAWIILIALGGTVVVLAATSFFI